MNTLPVTGQDYTMSPQPFPANHVAHHAIKPSNQSAPSSPELSRRQMPSGVAHVPILFPSTSEIQVSSGDLDSIVTEGTYVVNSETGEISLAQVPMLPLVPSTSATGSMSTLPSLSSSPQLSSGGVVLRFFLNDEVAKHRLRLFGESTVRTFSLVLKQHFKYMASQGFAVFMYDTTEGKLKVLKDTAVVDSATLYYVLENSRIDDLYRKVEKRVKKDMATLGAGQQVILKGSSGLQIWNSDNNPLQVDFIPDSELYLTEAGRIGLCMCPGRKKKKSTHEWDRDLDKDLVRIKEVYKADVVVSLVRRSELAELRIPNLVEEIEKMGMESIWFPIKDKWIPESMADLIRLVDALVTRLKSGKIIAVHCNGGKGRSGTVAVACLVAMGQRVDKSIDVVRKARSGTIRNPLQIVYVKRFKSAFKSFAKRKKALIEARGGSQNMPKEEWDKLAQQVASDAVLESSSSGDESDGIGLDPQTPTYASMIAGAAANFPFANASAASLHTAPNASSASHHASPGSSKLKSNSRSKEEEKLMEKLRKDQEKAIEKARKEDEKAHEKQRKEEEKAHEKQRKEEEKAHEKLRKEEEKTAGKRGSAQLAPGAWMEGSSTDSSTSPSPGSGKLHSPPTPTKPKDAKQKRFSTEISSDSELSGSHASHLAITSSAPAAVSSNVNATPNAAIQSVGISSSTHHSTTSHSPALTALQNDSSARSSSPDPKMKHIKVTTATRSSTSNILDSTASDSGDPELLAEARVTASPKPSKRKSGKRPPSSIVNDEGSTSAAE